MVGTPRASGKGGAVQLRKRRRDADPLDRLVERLLLRRGQAQLGGDLAGQVVVDAVELFDDALPDLDGFAFAQFEGVRGDDMLRLRLGHALVEHPRLAVVVLETGGTFADLLTVHLLGVVPEHVGVRPGSR